LDKEFTMPVLTEYALPAFIQDFPPGSANDFALKWRWNINVSGWIAQAMPAPPSYFYDPEQTDIPTGTRSVLVSWGAFPGRLIQYYSNNPPIPPTGPYKLTMEQIYQLADTGYYSDAGTQTSFPQIPQVICPQADWSAGTKIFGPYGPRGWLDEYCEWSAARDTNGNLIRIDFACENPEYWNTLWKVSPETVCSLYAQILNYDVPPERAISVSLDDLTLFLNGQAVIDPETGGPVYNPLNRWNSGPVAVRTGAQAGFTGGAIHLTSTPNTLQTELGLAGAATVQYQPPNGKGNSDAQALICCGNYGQEYRHSDPTIGQTVNQVVGGQFISGENFNVCLANPVGLYIQTLNNSGSFSFGPGIAPGKLPAGAAASDVWQIVRGAASVIDPVTGSPFPGAMILHVVCQIPSAWLAVYPTMTLADILINNEPIKYAGQVANQFNIGLYARPLAASAAPPPAPCANTALIPGAPLQSMLFSQVWAGYYENIETAPTGQTMSLASNSTFIAPQLLPDGVTQEMTMTCVSPTPGTTPQIQVLLPDGSGPDPFIAVQVLGQSFVNGYAVPGNSFPPSAPNTYTALSLALTVKPGAASGLRPVRLTDPVGGINTLPAAFFVLKG
jgi:hypothetical protein